MTASPYSSPSSCINCSSRGQTVIIQDMSTVCKQEKERLAIFNTAVFYVHKNRNKKRKKKKKQNGERSPDHVQLFRMWMY